MFSVGIAIFIVLVSVVRASLDLSKLTIDRTHDLNVHLEDEAGSLRILITITGAVSSTDHETSASTRDEIIRRYVSIKHFERYFVYSLRVAMH